MGEVRRSAPRTQRPRRSPEQIRKAKERQRRKRIKRRIILLGDLVAIMVLLIFLGRGIDKLINREESVHHIEWVMESTGASAPASESDSTEVSGYVLDQRRILEDEALEQLLAGLALENGDIADIYTERGSYPEELLESMCNNLELVDFVKGYLTADGTVTGGFTEEELEADFPLLLQWDSRWGYASYGSSNIGIAGCGPTCMSMVIVSLTKDETATPDVIADYSMENGCYVQGVGTAWELMTVASTPYGVIGHEASLDETAMKNYLDWGCPIICAMRPGDFTSTGHFIVIYDYDETGFLVNDPNSRARSEQTWTYEKLFYQIKNLWYYQLN